MAPENLAADVDLPGAAVGLGHGKPGLQGRRRRHHLKGGAHAVTQKGPVDHGGIFRVLEAGPQGGPGIGGEAGRRPDLPGIGVHDHDGPLFQTGGACVFHYFLYIFID